MWLFVILVGVPILEIALFIQVGGAIGLFPTLGIVILTAVIGTFMLRAQGVAALAGLRHSLSGLQDPTEPLAHGAMVLVSGVLLLTPGFFTDAVGFLLLIPAVRRWLFRWVRARISVQTIVAGNAWEKARPYDGETIDGEYSADDDPGLSPPGSARH